MATPTLVNTRSPMPVQASRMAAVEQRIGKIDEQISTGVKLVDPSDDPAGYNRAMQLVRQQSVLKAESDAIARSNDRLLTAENAVKTATDALMRAKDLALLASNAAISENDRKAILAEVRVLRDQLKTAANAQDESGRYIFAGSKGASAAYVDQNGKTLWNGAGDVAGAEAAKITGVQVQSGQHFFGDDENGAFAQLASLEKALQEADPVLRDLAMKDVLDGLDASTSRLIDGRSQIGAAMARLETEANRIEESKLSVTEALSDIRDVDLTAAYAELAALQLTLSAAQGSFSMIYGGSLFDRLG